MSYRSRLYNHRNAHASEEGQKQKPFFAKQHGANKAGQKGSFFQAKLAINAPGDSYEREADSVAREVVSKSAPGPVAQQEKMTSVQRRAANPEEEKQGTKEQRMEREKEKTIWRMSDGPEKEKPEGMQKKAAPQKEDDELKKAAPVQTKQETSGATASPQLSSKIESGAGRGATLPPKTLNEMSHSFGVDFSGVRVHSDSEAANMNKELQAHAFTHGNDIYFNQGKYNPETPDGKFLLAHELTHVVQQSGGTSAIDTKRASHQPNGHLSPAPEVGIQKWSLFGNDEEESEKKPEAPDSGGGVLDWMADAGGEAVDWAKDKAEAAGDAIGQVSGSVVENAKEKAGELTDAAGQAGKGLMNSAQGVLDDVGSSLFESKKSNALQQIDEAFQKLSGQQTVFLTTPQLHDISRHTASVRNESDGAISLPDLVPAGSAGVQGPEGTQPVQASSVEALLDGMKNSVSSLSLPSASGPTALNPDAFQNRFVPPPLPAKADPVTRVIVIIVVVVLIIVILLLAIGAYLLYKKKKEYDDPVEVDDNNEEKKEEKPEGNKKTKPDEKKDAEAGRKCLDEDALKTMNNTSGYNIIRNLYGDNYVQFRKDIHEKRKGPVPYCQDNAAIKSDRKEFFFKIDKTFQHCILVVCNKEGSVLATAPGVKHASLEGGDTHAEKNALPSIKAQLDAKTAEERTGAQLISTCFDFACNKSADSCEPTLNLFVAANLPGGSFKSLNSRNRPEMEQVCDASFDFSIRKACP